MEPKTQNSSPTSFATLVGQIISDSEKLVRQEIALARSEIQAEWGKGKSALATVALTFAAFLLAAFLFGFGLVYLLHEPLGLPLWSAFIIVALGIFGIGYGLFQKAKTDLSKINFVPRDAAETLKENVQWIKNPN